MSPNTMNFHTCSLIHCWLYKIKFISALRRKEESIPSGVRGCPQNFLFGETRLSLPFGVKVLFNGDVIVKFLEAST